MEKENGRMRKLNRIFVIPAVLLLVVFLSTNLFSEQVDTDKPPLKPSNPQLNKSEVIQRTQKLQMPFIANEGQVDERVAFYSKTFEGTVFVTKSGEIVYALPKSGDVEVGETHRKAAKCAKERSEKHISHKDTKNTQGEINKDKTGYTGLTGYMGKEGQCIVHRTLCAMYPYCTWNFPVHYSETNSPLKRGTHPLIPSREGNGVWRALKDGIPEWLKIPPLRA